MAPEPSHWALEYFKQEACLLFLMCPAELCVIALQRLVTQEKCSCTIPNCRSIFCSFTDILLDSLGIAARCSQTKHILHTRKAPVFRASPCAGGPAVVLFNWTPKQTPGVHQLLDEKITSVRQGSRIPRSIEENGLREFMLL